MIDQMLEYQKECFGFPEATPIFLVGEHVRAKSCPEYVFKVQQIMIVENGEQVRYSLLALSRITQSICLNRVKPNIYGAWQEQLIRD